MVIANGAGGCVIIGVNLLVARLAEELGDIRSGMGTERYVVTSTFVSLDASATRSGSVVVEGGGVDIALSCEVDVWGVWAVVCFCVLCGRWGSCTCIVLWGW